MAVALAGGVGLSSVSPATSLTFAYSTSGSNRYLTVSVIIDSSSTVTGVTYNGVAMTNLVSIRNTGGHIVYIWGLVAPATGSNNVVVTASSSTTIGAGAIAFTGVNQTTPTSSPQTNQADAVTSSSLTVTSKVDDMVIDTIGSAISAPTVGAGQTQRYSLTPLTTVFRGSTETGASSVTMSWTMTSSDVAHAGINLLQVSPTFVPRVAVF